MPKSGYPKEGQPGRVVWIEYYLVRSEDEGNTFLSPVRCIPGNGRYSVNNDRVILLSDGRIFFSAAMPGKDKLSKAYVFFSDDDGRSFRDGGIAISSPVQSDTIGLQEPEPFE